MWTRTHLFPKKEAKAFSLVLFFLILSFFSFSLKTEAATIHSSKQGGLWTHQSTWVGEIVPTADDDIIIDSSVEIPYLSEQHAKNITITQNGHLNTQYRAGTLYTENIQNEGTITALKMYVNGDVENNGTIDTSVINLHGNIINNGEIIRCCNTELSDIIFYGTEPKTIQGIGDYDITITLMDDLYVNDPTILPNLHTQGHIIHGDIELHGHGRNWTSGGTEIEGTLSLVGLIQIFSDIYAEIIKIKPESNLIFNNKNHGHLYGKVVMEEGSSMSNSRYGGNIHIHNKLKTEGNARISANSMIHFYDDVDFRGEIHAPFVTIANENKGGAHFFYEYVLNGYHGTINGEESYDKITSVKDENGNSIPLKDILLNRTQVFKWRTRADDNPWGPWHYFNDSRYLEENTHFFTTSVNDVTEGEAQEIVIHAEDGGFSGDVQLSVDEGSISPSVVHMENGEVTVSVAFDTPQEDAILSLQSIDHPLLTGSSPPFNVLHAVRAHFFSMPPVTEARVGEVLSIPLSAEEEDYEGDVEITFHDGNGEEELLSPLFHMKDGKVSFWYELRREADNAFFSFRDVERDYLRGESIPFRILPKKKKRNRGGTRRTNPRVETHIVSEIFITQGEVEQGDEQSEQEETAPSQDNNESGNSDTNGGNDESGNEEEQEEPHYLLENTCLDIHSELPVLKKGTSDHENTKKLQDFLIAKHYLTPPSDRIFGNQTKTALKNFQQNHKLTPDGIFGQGSSHFIDIHCGSIPMREESREDNEEDTQQENQESNIEEQSNQDEQTNDNTHNNDEEPTLWSEVWDEVSGWFAGLFGGGGDSESEDESGVSGGDGEEEEEEEDIHQYVTREMLQNAFNLNVDNEIVYEINRNFPLYNILTKERQAHFLSQVTHESGLRVVEENGNYSFSTIKRYFPRNRYPKFYTNWRFYMGNRERILNYLYRNRMGNRDEASGDGFRYRGRGLIQLTGKDNYRGFTYDWNEKNHSDQRDFIQNPDLLLQKKYGTASAFFFWRVKNINNVANGSDENSIRNVTLRVNGGLIGFSDRRRKFNAIYQELTENDL